MSNFDNSIIEIPLEDIHLGVNVKNIRSVFSDQELRELADSIHRDGLMNPLTIMQAEDKDGNPIYELVAGERRYRALQYVRMNIDTTFLENGVPCITYTGTVQEAEYVNASENIDRQNIDDIDLAAWLHRRTQEGEPQVTLAEKLHRSENWVSQRVLFFERAVEDLKQLLREGLISFTAAYELAKNCTADEQKKRVARSRAFNEKISVESAANANKPDKTAKPSKKAKAALLARAEGEVAKGSQIAIGIANALRWVDGLITDEEIEALLDGAEEVG